MKKKEERLPLLFGYIKGWKRQAKLEETGKVRRGKRFMNIMVDSSSS